MKKKLLLWMLIMGLAVTACAPARQAIQRSTTIAIAPEVEAIPASTLVPAQESSTPPPTVTAAGVSPTAAPSPALPAATSTPVEAAAAEAVPLGELRRQWAVDASANIDFFDPEWVTGGLKRLACQGGFAGWYGAPVEPGEVFIEFNFAFAVILTEIHIAFTENPEGEMRVEALDSSSGVGRLVFSGAVDAGSGACPRIFSIRGQSDATADRLVLTFASAAAAARVTAVELVGWLPGFTDIPVLWRVPIPSDSPSDPDSQYPGGLAVEAENTVLVANGRQGLFRYDVEGNLLKHFNTPSVSNIRDAAVMPDVGANGGESDAGEDRGGYLVVTDSVYKWWIVLDHDGLQVTAGGEDFGWDAPKDVAVHPHTGDIYVLDERDETYRVRVYRADTGQWVEDLVLDGGGFSRYAGLSFDGMGFLYVLDKQQGVVIKIDPASGEEVNTLGYQTLARTSLSDMALDAAGNLYVLANASPDGSAVIQLDPHGSLLRRWGGLTYDGSGWGEGVFLFPLSIAVTADGRFVFVCESGFLTAFLLEE